MKKQTDQQVADKMIKIMQDAGLTPDEMLKAIKLARHKYEAMKKQLTATQAMPYDAMLAAGLFQSGKTYYAQHMKFREEWVIIGISKDYKKVCVAGWPPTIAQADDFDNWEVAKNITDEELKHREKEFGSGWL